MAKKNEQEVKRRRRANVRTPRSARTVRKQRALQAEVDSLDQHRAPKSAEQTHAMQAGARTYPEPPLPKQHQVKPGREASLEPAPMYDAPYYKGSEKLLDKVALITGGDSGIGRAVAVLFAREGADVAIVYLNEHDDAKVTQHAVEQEGRRCILLAGDVADGNFCRQAVKQTVEKLGRLNVLVNNAAFQLHSTQFEDLTEAHFDQTLKTNLYGYFNMTRAAMPHLDGGVILNTGSVTGINGSKHLLDYAMTKGGIHAFTRSLAGSLMPRGIRVNAIAPGPVWTPFNPADATAEHVAHFGESSCMKRPAQPEEIAPAYVFLASSHCSSYITGEVLPVIGGY